ncbi:MAG: glycosyltransferase family 9 protein [Candidatus Korobacteraceae bacterium]
MKRILIVRLSAMGDVLHAMPAVIALRRAFPAANIGWVVERRWRPLLAADSTTLFGTPTPERPLVDHIHIVDTAHWRSKWSSNETLQEIRLAVRELRDGAYDLAVDFQGTIKSATSAALSRAPQRLGFTRPREKPAALFYTHTVDALGRHVVEQNMSLVRAVTSQIPGPTTLPLPMDVEAERHYLAELNRLQMNSYALINPGAGWGAKQWSAQSFGEVARGLASLGLRSLVNFGPGEESLAQQVVHHSCGAAIALSMTLSQLIAFTRRARIFLGGDTGPMHLAAALGVPVVALFGPTDPVRNGPFGTEHVVLRNPLSTTSYSHIAQQDAGLSAITSSEVTEAAARLLARTGGLRE